MKTVLLTRRPDEPLTQLPEAVCLPDSALVLSPRPLFIPDYVPTFRLAFCPVIRISRLGKCIAGKFAKRYYNSIAPLIRFYPESGIFPATDLLAAGDSLAYVGSFAELSLDDTGETEQFSFEFSGNAFSAPFTKEYPTDILDFDRAIETVSRFMTLKNGDLIAPFSEEIMLDVPLEPDLKINISTLGIESRFRFK